MLKIIMTLNYFHRLIRFQAFILSMNRIFLSILTLSHLFSTIENFLFNYRHRTNLSLGNLLTIFCLLVDGKWFKNKTRVDI